VKLSLFDVTDAVNPAEISKYTFPAEYWSEALDNHRAFLADVDREVIFIPGSRGGYMVSYAGRKLTLAKAIEGGSVKRAAYIDDTFYVVSNRRVVALDEDDWSEINRLEW
jgi:uncharacterized secreted protein with C-terminal beta-propeller domain